MQKAIHRAWLLGLVLASTALAPSARADEWPKTYTVSGKPDLRVETDDGNIEISNGAVNQVSVRVVTTGWKVGTGGNDVRISESQTGNHVEIIVKVPHLNFNWFGTHGRSVKVQIQVPSEADLDLRSGDGNITSGPVTGHIQIDTGDGHVNAQGLHGDVKIHSGDGHVEGTGFDGNLNVDTGDGHITVRGRFDVLYLKTGDGSIQADVESGSKISSSWTVHSGDGHINVRLPEAFGADLDVRTGDGHISLDFPVTVQGSLSQSRIHGKMNGGGGTLAITSGDGSIRIGKL